MAGVMCTACTAETVELKRYFDSLSRRLSDSSFAMRVSPHAHPMSPWMCLT